MLAKEPSQRFATARELSRELRRVQIEYFGDDWPEDLPALDSLAGEPPMDSRIAIARELDGLMKTMAIARRRRRSRAWLVAGLILAFAAGGAAAWLVAQPSSLLADAKEAAPVIPRQSSVLRQWYLASQSGTESAWQSVIDYFPEKRDFTLRAQQQLALIYLRDGDFNRAMPIFEKLANLGDDEQELRVFGLAGKCGVLSLRGKYRESADLLVQLLPLRDKLTSEPMRKLVENAVKKNRTGLGPQTAHEWDAWFEEQFRDDDS